MKLNIGERSGSLTVTRIEKNNRGERAVCKCDCGESYSLPANKFRNGRIKSCGCLQHAGKIKELTGMIFGKLTVVARDKSVSVGSGVAATWRCRCECGNEITKAGHSLRNSKGFVSCGCRSVSPRRTHGMTRSPIYCRWSNMLRRCNSPSNSSYADYGGRGIAVCDRWLDFANFYEDMGDPPYPQATIERKDNEGSYCPSNCRWASRSEQSVNKRSTRYLTYNGRTMCLSHWAQEIGISREGLSSRLAKGWPVSRALSTPKLR
jgi:hypothetical protein